MTKEELQILGEIAYLSGEDRDSCVFELRWYHRFLPWECHPTHKRIYWQLGWDCAKIVDEHEKAGYVSQ